MNCGDGGTERSPLLSQETGLLVMAGSQNVRCWDVPCTMSNVFVKRPKNQM